MKDASETNPFEELCTLAMQLLVLPWSNADVERLFSQMNLVKTKLRNRMGSKLLDSILTIKSGLRRQNIHLSYFVVSFSCFKKSST
ncbi:Dimer Tnp hAT domain-containing protein [Aphis craccivora]|uniref:Dimer Tnp hAT domain-containing protein n=1 Tax=Aphis craccivora TaxID=307492 RepID=A0A6G0VQF1_APHCR|nr:Dimer Tnp hAT domain-containing protein [Aphis craccivora]